jgi:hypothetical protein
VILDARYERVREAGRVVDCALLVAIGVTASGHRRVLSVSVALSEAEVHWWAFLDSLIERGLRGVKFIASHDHVLSAGTTSTPESLIRVPSVAYRTETSAGFAYLRRCASSGF